MKKSTAVCNSMQNWLTATSSDESGAHSGKEGSSSPGVSNCMAWVLLFVLHAYCICIVMIVYSCKTWQETKLGERSTLVYRNTGQDKIL